MPYAYMVRCADGSYYSGSAVNLKKRIDAHNAGTGAKYTRVRLPVKLVYYEAFETRSEALKREAALKKLSHTKKQELAETFSQAGLEVF
ncbi:MAG: GIY-YIG nuclease family protein [Christensenellales bacterium]|jgi:putative endonuclease